MRAWVLTVLLASLSLLAGCQPLDRNNSGPAAGSGATLRQEATEIQEFRVTAVRRPHSGKNSRPFRVSLESTKDGHAYTRIRVARRCYSWRDVKVGQVVKLKEVVRHFSDGTVNRRIANIETICPK